MLGSQNGLTHGQKIVTLYFAIFYLFPMLANLFFYNEIVSVYKVYPLTFYSGFLILSVYLLYMGVSRYLTFELPVYTGLSNLSEMIAKRYSSFRFLLGLLVIGIGISNIYFQYDLNGYRYSSISLSERGYFLLFFSIGLTTILTADLFYRMFVKDGSVTGAISSQKYINILLSIGLLLLTNGTASAFLAYLAIFYSVFPNIFYKIFFLNKKDSLVDKINKIVLSFIVLIIIFFTSWITGEKIKSPSLIGFSDMIVSTTSPTPYDVEIFKKPKNEVMSRDDVGKVLINHLKVNGIVKHDAAIKMEENNNIKNNGVTNIKVTDKQIVNNILNKKNEFIALMKDIKKSE